LERLFEVLRTLSAAGQTILLVEQVIERSLEVADEVFLLSGGQIVSQGTSSEITAKPEFRDLYFRGTAQT
jgi:branched-chain amino acid transport system ATP-binding protein